MYVGISKSPSPQVPCYSSLVVGSNIQKSLPTKKFKNTTSPRNFLDGKQTTFKSKIEWLGEGEICEPGSI